MVTVRRKRNSGKTTTLLHYMVCNPFSVMVVRDASHADAKKREAAALELDIDRKRFVGMTNACGVHNRMTLIADDLDVMMQIYPEIVAGFIGRVTVATMTLGGRD